MLRFAADMAQAEWLDDSLAGGATDDDVFRLLLLGPGGYEAYARVLVLPDPKYPGQPEAEVDDAVIVSMPSEIDLLTQLVEVIVDATTMPAGLCFHFWEGWPFDPDLPSGSRIDIAGIRSYALAMGTWLECRQWHDVQAAAYGPDFVWPADRAWCLAHDVDSHFVGVGGSRSLIEAVKAAPALTVLDASRDSYLRLYG